MATRNSVVQLQITRLPNYQILGSCRSQPAALQPRKGGGGHVLGVFKIGGRACAPYSFARHRRQDTVSVVRKQQGSGREFRLQFDCVFAFLQPHVPGAMAEPCAALPRPSPESSYAAGKVKWKTDPWPSWLVTPIVPPCASTIAFAIDSPIPVPWIVNRWSRPR